MIRLQPRTRWYNLLYPMLVFGTVTIYAIFAVVPFFATGAYRFSYREIAAQAGVPGYPAPLGFGGILAIVVVPLISLLPGVLMLYNFPLEQQGYSSVERRIIWAALIAHAATLVFMLTYGRLIFTWIVD